jgi:small subunit ribosomal protein S1
MSKKIMVDGKPIDMESLFEDDSAEPKTVSGSDFGSDPARASGFDEQAWWKNLDQMERQGEAKRILRPGEAIDVTVATLGTENILFTGDGIEGVISRDEYSTEELALIKAGASMRVYVVTAARKGGLLSVEASREARVMTGGGNLEALREAQASRIPVSAKVTAENKGGYEVSLQGAKGFVPFSQMELGTRLSSDQYIGQTFQFLVTRVEGRNVVLSRIALQREEQQANQEKLLADIEPGKIMTATIRKIESFGLFVDLGAGLSALVPQSEASWSRGQPLHSRFSPGESVMVKIIKLESFQGKPRISASIKQADADPWDHLPEQIAPGKYVSGTITRLAEFGAFIELLPGIEGLIHISEMSSRKRIHRPGEMVQPGQQVEVRILSVDLIKKRIGVSMKDESVSSDSFSSDSAGKGTKGNTSHPSSGENLSTISVPSKSDSGMGALGLALMKVMKK